MLHMGSRVPRWQGTKTRLLRDERRHFSTAKESAPLVIEASESRDASFLKRFLATHSDDLHAALQRHGAVVLRGFAVHTDRDFEDCLLAIRGFRAMNGYFMAEPGRDRADGSDNVFHTNTRFKTGGSFHIGGFHSENYYSTDVPRFQSFWCKKAPWLGGETALVNMANAYSDLPAALRSRLEAQPACSDAWPIAQIADRYQLPETEIERFCERMGLPIVQHGQSKLVVLYKPSVYVQPQTRKRSLQVNLSAELTGLDEAIRTLLSSRYRGWKWALHRLGWRHPAWAKILLALEYLPRLVLAPRVLKELVGSLLRGVRARAGDPPPRLPRLADVAEDVELDTLALAIVAQTSLLSWQRGDILIFDNCQLLHSGMPGFGPRELRVMLFNPIPIRFPVTSGVLDLGDVDAYHEPLDVRLKRLRVSHSLRRGPSRPTTGPHQEG